MVALFCLLLTRMTLACDSIYILIPKLHIINIFEGKNIYTNVSVVCIDRHGQSQKAFGAFNAITANISISEENQFFFDGCFYAKMFA